MDAIKSKMNRYCCAHLIHYLHFSIVSESEEVAEREVIFRDNIIRDTKECKNFENLMDYIGGWYNECK